MIQLLLLLMCAANAFAQVGEEEWELVGSRSFEWEGKEALRCRHWDKVAVRWHLSSCSTRHGKRSCTGGTNADLATVSQNSTELPRWRNAFTYVQLPEDTVDHHDHYLKLAVGGYDESIAKVHSISPLKIDVDWQWTVDERGCNHFTVRMSALSTIDRHRLGELEQFCREFDRDGFVICDNL